MRGMVVYITSQEVTQRTIARYGFMVGIGEVTEDGWGSDE